MITPILKDVVTLVGEAVTAINALVGEPVEVILASVDGTVTVALSEVAKLLAGVLTVSFMRSYLYSRPTDSLP